MTWIQKPLWFLEAWHLFCSRWMCVSISYSKIMFVQIGMTGWWMGIKRTPRGENMRADPLDVSCQFVINAWNKVDLNTVVKSFKKCYLKFYGWNRRLFTLGRHKWFGLTWKLLGFLWGGIKWHWRRIIWYYFSTLRRKRESLYVNE